MVAQEATLTITDSEFRGNFADRFGAGIMQLSVGSMDVQNTLFNSNTAGHGGGAIAVATASRVDR